MTTLTGVTPAQVGEVYDLAIGYDPGTGTTNMVGYVLAPGSEWEEASNLQDSEHLVQVASPNQSDRFSRQAKVSQGDWSGGERQELFVDATKYYSSLGLETGQPGNLKLSGRYTTVGWPANVGDMARISGSISADANLFYFTTTSGASGNFVAMDALLYTMATYAYGAAALGEVVRGGDQQYIAGAAGIIYAQGGVGVAQSNDQVYQGTTGRTMAYFQGRLYYFKNGIGQQAPLTYITPPFPGAGPGTQADVIWIMEAAYDCMGSGPTGLYLVSGAANTGQFFVYLWNGATRTFVGQINGLPVDIREAGGDTYLLCSSGKANFPGVPIIYKLSGGNFSIFDDYRTVTSAFKPVAGGSGAFGRLATDGTYLYLAWPGMSVKRYKLATGAVSDIGTPGAPWSGVNLHFVEAALSAGILAETIPGVGQANNYLSVFDPNKTPQAGATGVLDSSSFDFGTPSVVKEFHSIEVELRQPLPVGASVRLLWTLDNQTTSTEITPVQVLSSNNLVGYLPPGTKGYRMQVHLILTANGLGQGPVVRYYSLTGNVGRIWKGTLACRRNQQGRNGMTDPQGVVVPGLLPSQSLIANIENAYHLASGNVTLYVPDAAAPSGVTTVTGIIQDYHRRNPGGMSPALRPDADGSYDMEGDVEVLIAEAL